MFAKVLPHHPAAASCAALPAQPPPVGFFIPGVCIDLALLFLWLVEIFMFSGSDRKKSLTPNWGFYFFSIQWSYSVSLLSYWKAIFTCYQKTPACTFFTPFFFLHVLKQHSPKTKGEWVMFLSSEIRMEVYNLFRILFFWGKSRALYKWIVYYFRHCSALKLYINKAASLRLQRNYERVELIW